ncbi:tetratricopeptide repeat protein [Burkholderia ambifaria]|uniref:tetratricopeptide repeat protein n=1 Tax=Burkholderia ambifaria TaxID=152480 RepID=UPI00158D664C|nr:tetratricopeptide repeat protein [Burkholderia ambifaria]
MNHDKSVTQMCPEPDMLSIVQAMGDTDVQALQVLDASRRKWPYDPRVHLLLGALHASQQQYDPARSALEEALRLSPDYPIASFMLGFLELVNGHVERAELAWVALDALPVDDTLRIFKFGLISLTRDRFAEALQRLQQGVASNTQYPLINRYIHSVIEQVRGAMDRHDESNHDDSGPSFSTPYGTPSRS